MARDMRVDDGDAETGLARLADEARDYVRHAKSENTRRAYLSDWEDFRGWCQDYSASPCPAEPQTVALYVTDRARTRKPSTLGRRLTAISQYHNAAGQLSPTASIEVRSVMSGIRRRKGMARIRKKPLLAADLAKAVLTLPDTILGIRNRALLLVGFAGALRRSELVALSWEQIERAGWQSVEEINPQVRGGVKITVAKSKTDQAGEGRAVGIPFGENPLSCPVRALEAWREASELSAGPVFRVVGRAGKVMDEALSDRAVARLVKQVAKATGLNPQEFSGHSLRSGLATSAAAAGASERSIMEQTGHRDLKTARTYIRDGSLFRENAAGKTGI
jgi:site-specific recombinase XerD